MPNIHSYFKTLPSSWKSIDNDLFFLIAGPCAIESYAMLDDIAAALKEICQSLSLPFIFKASYRKANRSKLSSFTGIGDEKALEYLDDIKSKYDLVVTTDIHTAEEAPWAAEVADVLQIPAFLCRQTELLVAAANTMKIVNVKKGQFLSPESTRFAVEKIRDAGNSKVCLTERGNSFGYGDLVVDFRGIPIMQKFDVPTIVDCTHSMQKPNQSAGVTGGVPEFIPTMAKAAIAVGADGIFIETHPNPQEAKSDGANMLEMGEMKGLLEKLIRIRKAII